jgi:hypothetical protein
MSTAKVFLSHNSSDKPLVEKVADALCRLGIIPWLDINMMSPGISLTLQLKEAIHNQTAIALFLSKKAASSKWVQEELSEAIRLEDEGKNKDWIIPIYLSDPLDVVSTFPLLADRWLTPNRDRVDRLGIAIDSLPTTIKNSPDLTADHIACEVSKHVLPLLNFKGNNNINIVIDQRGTGSRTGNYELPPNLERENNPTLVFRPDTELKTPYETLIGQDWIRFRKAIEKSISLVMGAVNQNKKITLLGQGQLGLAFLLGRCFDRTHRVTMYCRHPSEQTLFTNEGQDFRGPIEGGNPDCETTQENKPHDKLLPAKIKPGEIVKTIALYIGKEIYLPDVKEHIESLADKLPMVFVSTRDFNHNDDVMTLVQDTVALLQRFNRQNGTKALRLYCDLPFNVIPILSANLVHVMDNVEFMEYRRDLKGKNPVPQDMYTSLPMID